jgi:predicted transglutaminase-like cysteine proteinase
VQRVLIRFFDKSLTSSLLHTSPRTRAFLIFVVALISIAPGLAERLDLSDKVLAFVEKKYGAPAHKRVTDWKRLMENSRNKSESEKLELVNRFFNQTPFVSDIEHWGKEDYWATPIEMLATSGGDCEDFAIGKYFTLVQMGVPIKKLQITYVKAMNWNPINQAHMVLAYYQTPEAIPNILDNLIPEIKPASQRKDLTPVYSFNGDGLWLAKERGLGKNVGGSSRIKLWTDLSSRMGKEADGQHP